MAQTSALQQLIDVDRLKNVNPHMIDILQREIYARTTPQPQQPASHAPTMTGVSEIGMHGHAGVGKRDWDAPLLVTQCDEEARPGYNTMAAHEYLDTLPTLRKKVKLLAEFMRAAQHCCIYSGAGLSTSSGIADYASKSTKSVATGDHVPKPKLTGLAAHPTFAHFALASMGQNGLIAHWVQQNHDGLIQKAGYPHHHVNEIHGAWFEAASNPVVPMSGSLRSDLCTWMEKEANTADLVLALGTSLCGMNADQVVSRPAKKAIKHGVGLGAVIVGLQRTQMDDLASLRIYAKLDDVMLLLALELQIPVSMELYKPDIPTTTVRVRGHPHIFNVPYDAKGNKTTDGSTTQWNLSVGANIRVTGGPGVGFTGNVTALPTDDVCSASHWCYSVALPCNREGARAFGRGFHAYALGTWVVEAACKGLIPTLPFVNV